MFDTHTTIILYYSFFFGENLNIAEKKYKYLINDDDDETVFFFATVFYSGEHRLNHRLLSICRGSIQLSFVVLFFFFFCL